jgi:hypothetical protein
MMYDKLYQYLIQHKELPVPGIGTFLLQRKSARIDFPNRKINPPLFSITLQSDSYVPVKSFFTWLGLSLGITDREAIFRFNDFAFDLKKQISEGAVINWNGVGVLNKGLAGDVKFMATATPFSDWAPITAEKVIRDKAEHMVRVGEDEKTSLEMTEMLNQQEEKKSYWWTFALILVFLSVIFIGWYFSKHGVVVSATANTKQLIPLEAGSSNRPLP